MAGCLGLALPKWNLPSPTFPSKNRSQFNFKVYWAQGVMWLLLLQVLWELARHTEKLPKTVLKPLFLSLNFHSSPRPPHLFLSPSSSTGLKTEWAVTSFLALFEITCLVFFHPAENHHTSHIGEQNFMTPSVSLHTPERPHGVVQNSTEIHHLLQGFLAVKPKPDSSHSSSLIFIFNIYPSQISTKSDSIVCLFPLDSISVIPIWCFESYQKWSIRAESEGSHEHHWLWLKNSKTNQTPQKSILGLWLVI